MSFPSSLAAIFLFTKLFSLLLGMVREKRDGKGDQKEKYFVVHKQKQTVALPKQVGCFNHRVVTLVADKMERQ